MEVIGSKQAPLGAVLVIHSWWGLTGSFRAYGQALAEAGYLVGLADLFDGQTASTETEARALRTHARTVPIYKRLGADCAKLTDMAAKSPAKIGVVGFSMGGHWAVWLSQRPEYRVAATALYYAARGGDFSRCRASVIAHFAGHDPWVSAAGRKTMERAIRKAGVGYRAHDYPDCGHWFAESARPRDFDAAAAQLALGRDLDHVQRHLGA
jgi:carboxymethylenebutenolidase